MEAKKTEKADLNTKIGLFFNIGLVASLLIIITAFEWRSFDDGSLVDLGNVSDDFEEMIEVPPTDIPPPPPPKIQQPEIIEVPDEEEIEDEIEIEFDVEITDDTKIEDLIITDAPDEEDYDQIFLVVEETAAPKGGMAAFYEFVQKKMKYPAQARRMGIEGRVFVEFVVNKDGTISDVKSIRGIGAGCDEEAVRVLQSAPPWNPGKQRGKAVKQRMVLPIIFQLG